MLTAAVSRSARAERLRRLRPVFDAIDEVIAVNSERVTLAFAASGLSAAELRGSTGYGYGDRGRERLDEIYAAVFAAETAMVRPQWISGTHALAGALRGCLEPGKRLWVIGGPVYDTLRPLLEDARHPLSLPRWGVVVRYLDGAGDPGDEVAAGDVVYLQRSRGYQGRPSYGESTIRAVAAWAHSHGAALVVDNCYGEFTRTAEPPAWGADLAVGSLLKNPGGGIAPTGAYIAGTARWVDRVAEALVAPGIGRDVGPTGPYLTAIAQGLFLAPLAVGEALKGTAYAALLFQDHGFRVDPDPFAVARDDIVVAVELGRAQLVEAFCRAVQALGPVDAAAAPEPWAMPGYADPVIMAAGGFVAGGSLELSADAPMRPPYRVFLQGGLVRWHTVLAAERALQAVLAAGAEGGGR